MARPYIYTLDALRPRWFSDERAAFAACFSFLFFQVCFFVVEFAILKEKEQSCGFLKAYVCLVHILVFRVPYDQGGLYDGLVVELGGWVGSWACLCRD